MRNVLRPPLQGLVLEAYGVGNGPDHDAEFIAAIAEATERGVVIVDCTQCLEGTVDLGEYATGSALAGAGVISGYDMTAEAALTKLYYLFSRGYSPNRVKREMLRDLRGEMTPSPAAQPALSGVEGRHPLPQAGEGSRRRESPRPAKRGEGGPKGRVRGTSSFLSPIATSTSPIRLQCKKSSTICGRIWSSTVL